MGFRVHVNVTSSLAESWTRSATAVCEDCNHSQSFSWNQSVSTLTCSFCESHHEENEHHSQVALLEQRYGFPPIGDETLRDARYMVAKELAETGAFLAEHFADLHFADQIYVEFRDVICARILAPFGDLSILKRIFGARADREPPLSYVKQLGQRALDLFHRAECRLREELEDPESLVRESEEVKVGTARAELVCAMLRMLPPAKVAAFLLTPFSNEDTYPAPAKNDEPRLFFGNGYELDQGIIGVSLCGFGLFAGEWNLFHPSVSALVLAALELEWENHAS